MTIRFSKSIRQIVGDMRECVAEGGPGEISAKGYSKIAEEIEEAHAEPFGRILEKIYDLPECPSTDEIKNCLLYICEICRKEIGECCTERI